MQPFPYPSDATHKIWSRLANWLQRYSTLKVWTTDDDGPLVYYKLTLWAPSSGELKTNKMTVRPVKTQISPVWSVFAVRMKDSCVLSYPLRAQRRLISLGRCPGWSESSLGTQVIVLVLSCDGSKFYWYLCYTCIYFSKLFTHKAGVKVHVHRQIFFAKDCMPCNRF